MKKIDYHIHADFSKDSKIKLSELIPLAMKLGYSELAITEHLDLLPQEVTSLGIPSLDKYKEFIYQTRIRYPDIKIHFGVEVGDYQSVKDLAEPLVKKSDFDIVLGSVHFVNNRINVAIPIKGKLTATDIIDYYEQNLLLVETCDIDVLAHLGVYKRYFQSSPDETHCLLIIKKIFEVMIKKGIALEINFSCLRKTYKHLLPEDNYLLLYKNLCGKLVTIGSDSHTLEQFDDNYIFAIQAVKQYNFTLLAINT